MHAAEAGHAIKRLLELVNAGPRYPVALQEAQAIFRRMGGEGGATGYLAEKLAAAQGSFEAWLSDGSDAQALRVVLLQDIEKLRKAIARGAAGQD
jgi:hypothetical protein